MSLSLLLAELVAVTGGTVHTMVPGESPRPATLLVRDDRVEALLAPSEPLPDGVDRIVDVAGRHVVPGLVDGLVYFEPDHDALYLAAGVTLVRDVGGDPTRVLLEREAAARARTPGPTLLTAGAVLDGTPPGTPQAIVLTAPEQAQVAVGELVAAGVDFLSLQPNLTEATWRAVLAEAAEAELDVWGHLPTGVSLAAGLAAGHRGIFYLDALLPEGVEWAFVLPIAFRATIEQLAEAGAEVVPMLSGIDARMARLEPDAEREAADAEMLATLGPHFEAWWRADLAQRRQGIDDEAVRVGQRVRGKQHQLLAELHAAGVPLLPGSSAPQPWFPPGAALHTELAAWVEAGVAAEDVLRAATRGAAEILGVEERHGSLAPGLSADFVVVDGDPREDLGTLARPAWVAVRGTLHDAQDLADRLKTLRIEQTRAREEIARPLDIPEPPVPEGAVVLQGQVETLVGGVRVGGERYAVVRELDGRIAYCGRMLTPGTATYPSIDVQLVQKTRDDQLEEFELEVNQGGNQLLVRGLYTAGRMNVRREFNGQVLDTKSALERVVTVSIGSVTALMMAARLGPLEDGDAPPYPVLHFHEKQEPEVVPWALDLDENGVFLLGTRQGNHGFLVDERGAVVLWEQEQAGGARVVTGTVAVDALGGPGLPLPGPIGERVAAARAAAEARAAEAAAAPPPAGASTTPGGDGG